EERGKIMGLLDDYGIAVDEYEAPGFEVPDGAYEFTVGDLFIKQGSTKNPDKSWIILEYTLDTGKKYSELCELPADAANPTEKEKDRRGRYRQRLESLGIPAERLNSVGKEDVVGTTGTFQLRTSSGTKGGTFQNIRNFRITDAGDNA